jgi:transposase InsO family protein
LHSDEPFTLLSDHDSLKYHKTMPQLSGRLARWIEKMAEFDYKIEHIPGVKNVVADALSRRSDLQDATPEQLAAARVARRARQRAHGGVRFALVLSPQEAALQRAKNKKAAEESHPPAADRPAPNAKGAIVMPSQVCTAHTAKGLPCKQRTAKGQYCWNHLRSISGLRIMKSPSIPGQLGLVAARALPAGTRIDYTGDKVPLSAAADGGNYFLEISRTTAIDAARTNCGEGRWVNDPRGTGSTANSQFVLYTPPGKPRQACIEITRLVSAGEEILIEYGNKYWRFHLSKAGIAARKRKRAPARRRPARPGPPNRLAVATVEHAAAALSLAVAVATLTRVTSKLTADIRKAAAADAAYIALLAAPPLGREVLGGLLFDDGRLCVPNDAALRTRILAECHDSVTGAHFGRDKTLEAVKSRFSWEGLTSAVEQYVATCDACQRNKPSQQLTPGLLMPLPLPERPCMAWTQDAVTGLPKTKRGHDAIQVYVERLCKLKHFAATHSTDGASELARSFVHTVVRAHGVPESVVSDRDPRFTATFYAELTKLMGIDLHMSTARHPQSDGQSEREIRTLITALRAFCNDHQDDWDDYLDMLELGFNSTVQASTQRSPLELLNGTKPRLPIDVALAPVAPKNPAALDRATRMQQALKFARDQLLGAQERQVANADRHRRPDAFAVGDRVLLSTEGLTLRDFGNKLCSRFIGPFPITAVVNANAYTLALPPQLKALHPTFNIEKLKRYRDGRAAFPDRPLPHPRPPPIAPADSNGDAVWEVERVTAKRKAGRGVQYLVAWKGYPAEENTWLSRSSLLPGAADALADFENSQLASGD